MSSPSRSDPPGSTPDRMAARDDAGARPGPSAATSGVQAPAAPRDPSAAPPGADAPAAPPDPSAAALDALPSPLAAALDSVGDRWTLLLVEALRGGARRFGDLQEALGGIAPNVLSQRLRRLEGEGLVLAQPYSERPQRYVYELTASGHELAGALRLLSDWGARHGESAEPPRHEACGTPVEVRWWCPTCERPVGDDESADLHYA
jgi:DNA-binding HxlR family transcriptional regulator